MNRCRESIQLSSYLDGQLDAKEKAGIEEHLKSCKLCSEELEQLKAVSLKLSGWSAPDAASGFDASVRNKIVAWELERGEPKMKKKTIAILVPSGVLAGILVFLFVGLSTRGPMQGRLRQGADQVGHQYALENKKYNEYEPYYKETTIARSQSIGSVVRGDSDYSAGKPKGAERLAFKNQSQQIYGSTSENVEREALPAVYDEVRPYSAPEGGSVIVVQPVLPATGQGEKIIRTADIQLEVEDGKAAYKKALAICQELGGYMASSNFYKDAAGREAGTISMRIPKDKFESAIDQLSALGKVEASDTNSQDVSQEYNNLKNQLDTSMIVYNKMLEALQKKQATIPEAMRIESELTPVLRKIQDLKNRIEYLNNAVSFTTVNVRMHEPAVSVKVLKDSKQQIKESLLNTGINTIRFIAGAIPVAILLIFWVLILLGAALLVKYVVVKLFKRG